MQALNSAGDQLHPTTGQHGADIAVQRIDDLDRLAVRHAIASADPPGVALDLGCGWGAQGLRLATLGWNTTLIDQLPVADTVAHHTGLIAHLPLRYVRADARLLQPGQWPTGIGIACCQRMLHYLPTTAAEGLLRTLRGVLLNTGRLYLSVSGLHSELGAGYATASAPPGTRFGRLAPAMAAKHGIHAPVCLYQPDELAMLADRAGFAVEALWTSDFGNVKAVLAPT